MAGTYTIATISAHVNVICFVLRSAFSFCVKSSERCSSAAPYCVRELDEGSAPFFLLPRGRSNRNRNTFLFSVSDFGYAWQTGTIHTKTPYRQFTKEEINASVGLHVGLRGINVTLKGTWPLPKPRPHRVRLTFHFFPKASPSIRPSIRVTKTRSTSTTTNVSTGAGNNFASASDPIVSHPYVV